MFNYKYMSQQILQFLSLFYPCLNKLTLWICLVDYREAIINKNHDSPPQLPHDISLTHVHKEFLTFVCHGNRHTCMPDYYNQHKHYCLPSWKQCRINALCCRIHMRDKPASRGSFLLEQNKYITHFPLLSKQSQKSLLCRRKVHLTSADAENSWRCLSSLFISEVSLLCNSPHKTHWGPLSAFQMTFTKH